MRIATFNANSIRSRMDAVLAWLAAAGPDVLCIQETKVVDGDFPVEPLAAAGYHAVFRGEKSYNGVALLSRVQPEEVRFGLDDGGPADETRLLHARVAGVHVVNTYVPQGRELDHAMYKYKLDWFARLRGYFDRHFNTRQKLVWAGDLNVAPEEADVFDPAAHRMHVCFHADVRRAFRAALEWGFVDVFRKHHPEPGRFSFFDYRTPDAAKRGLGWRVDHILASPAMARKSTDAFIDLAPRLGPKPSDHTFVAADFRI
ncbi:MAG: exodeoxyribonuclease III [Lentisphaerae bacterium]|nr:exodeoxyribonuclease III [Lentisphaerota bacterium]